MDKCLFHLNNRRMTLAGYLNVHCIRRQIDLTGPRDCTAVNEDLLEESRIPQRGEGPGKLFLPQLHPPRASVLEADKQAVVGFGLHFNYVPIH